MLRALLVLARQRDTKEKQERGAGGGDGGQWRTAGRGRLRKAGGQSKAKPALQASGTRAFHFPFQLGSSVSFASLAWRHILPKSMPTRLAKCRSDLAGIIARPSEMLGGWGVEPHLWPVNRPVAGKITTNPHR